MKNKLILSLSVLLLNASSLILSSENKSAKKALKSLEIGALYHNVAATKDDLRFYSEYCGESEKQELEDGSMLVKHSESSVTIYPSGHRKIKLSHETLFLDLDRTSSN